MWLGKLTALSMTHWVDWAVKLQHEQVLTLLHLCLFHIARLCPCVRSVTLKPIKIFS